MEQIRSTFWADEDMVRTFRAKCKERGVSQTHILKHLIGGWLAADDGDTVVMRVDIAEFLVDFFEREKAKVAEQELGVEVG